MKAPYTAPKGKMKKAKVPNHLQSLVDESGPVSPAERQEHAWLVADNVNIFVSVGGQVGWTGIVHYDIDTGDNRLTKQLHCHLGFHMEQLA